MHPFGITDILIQFLYSNYGGVGIIQNPTARFQREKSCIILEPQRTIPKRVNYCISLSWFEASYQYTDINNYLYSSVREFSGSQSLKDKSFDGKFLLRAESRLGPQLAVGFRDLAGTGLFGSEYLVASKFITNDIDISVGIGWVI